MKRHHLLLCLILFAPTALATPQTAAQFHGGDVTFVELDLFLVHKFAHQPEGKMALEHLVQRALIQEEARRRSLSITPAEVETRVAQLEAEMKKAGASLESTLEEKMVTRAGFAEMIGISILQERMIRQDLALGDGENPTAAQVELWLAEKTKKAAVERDRSKLKPGVLARVEDREIGQTEFGETLRTLIGPDRTRNLLRELAGIRLVEIGAREHKVTVTDEDLDREIEKRRKRFNEDGRFQGVTYEDFLKAQGKTVDGERSDPGLKARLLLEGIAEKIFPENILEAEYKKDPEGYLARYGESRQVFLLLVKAREGDDLAEGERTPEAAREVLLSLKERIEEEKDFGRIAKIYSEDEPSKRRGGLIGFLHRAEPGYDPSFLEALFAAPQGGLVGPLDTPRGPVLAQIGEVRPAPPHAEILLRIREELRKEHLRQLVGNAQITTYLDNPPK